MKNKLKLDQLKVKSFITNLNNETSQTAQNVKGGTSTLLTPIIYNLTTKVSKDCPELTDECSLGGIHCIV